MTRKPAQDHAEKTYERAHLAALIFCAAWPVALVFLLPDTLYNLPLGAVLTVAALVQFLYLPHWLARWAIARLSQKK
jgi:VIT1/CCC1 family predicted Fe2+/Mn2+ transporter